MRVTFAGSFSSSGCGGFDEPTRRAATISEFDGGFCGGGELGVLVDAGAGASLVRGE